MDNARLMRLREMVRVALDTYEAGLKAKLQEVPRGSGHAVNEFDHIQASLSEVKSAKRVLWMEN
jgi:hypothetical protein